MNENLRSALAVSAAIVLFSMIGSWAYLHGKALGDTIQVTGSAKKQIKSDLMIWKASVSSEAASLPEAYAKLTRDVEKTKAFLVAQGVPEDQIVTSAVTTTTLRRGPVQRTANSNAGDSTALNSQVAGYQLKQSVEVRSTDVDKVTAVSREVTELIPLGILLESEDPAYLYTHLAETKVEILAAAARDARERARQLADSTGSRVGGMRSAEMGVLQITAADANNVSDYGENDTKSLNKDITAVVHVTFALK
ncbi:MAG: SIMPL domain-containing protein [Candidatus Acidiferrales bacterium]